MSSSVRFVAFVLLVSNVTASACADDPRPTVEQILRDWERASAPIETLEVRFQRFIYDDVFRVEKRATGTFTFHAPNRGRLVVEPVEPSQAEHEDGRSKYRLEKDKSQSFEWPGDRLVELDADGKMVSELLTAEDKTEASWSFLDRLRTPQRFLPFVVDIRADDLQEQFNWRFVKQDANGYWLEAEPRTKEAAAGLQRCRVIINPDTFRTHAVEYTDPSGNLRNVYVFRAYRIESRRVEAPKP